MTYKTLMAHLAVGQSNAEVLRVVAELGAKLGSRIVGISACQPVQFQYGEYYVSGDVITACQGELQVELRNAETEFRDALADAKLALEWRSTYTTDALPHYLAGEARCADLIVTSTVTGGAFDSSRHSSIADLVMQSGRPVLLVPRSGARFPFDQVVVAWKDTREARLATAAALPILKVAKHVTVVEIADDEEQSGALGRTQDVAKWLAMHEITAEPLAVLSRGDDADALDAVLTDQQCDLVVAGAYGHNRMREWVFGGVTDNVLHGGRCALLAH